MEKFALLNLLKAIQTLSPTKAAEANSNEPAEPPAPPPDVAANKAPDTAPYVAPYVAPAETGNVMAGLLSRHEEIANRLRNKK